MTHVYDTWHLRVYDACRRSRSLMDTAPRSGRARIARPSPDAPPPGPERALSGAWAAVLIVATVGLHLWFAGRLELSPQEAYYWQYARHLDWSYFDHPPLAAWTIRSMTAVLGTTEWGVRAAAALHASVFAAFLFLAGRRLFGPKTALIALAAAVATPLISLGQLVITSDGPLLAGWAACFYFTIRALQEGRGAWLLAAGAAIGVASLGKDTGFLLAPQLLVALLLDVRGRALLRGPWLWLSLAIAVALFAPVLVWNSWHGWASFVFQFADRGAGLAVPSPARVARFVGLQAALLSPGVLVACWIAVTVSIRRWADASLRLCAIFSAPALLLFAAVSPFAWVKGNWPAPGYATAVLAAAALFASVSRGWRAFGVASAGVGVVATAYFHAAALWPAIPFPARDATTLGWRQLAARIHAERGRGADAFVAGCGYKVASELAFYLPDRPETYSSNMFGEPGLQYGIWHDDVALRGRTGLVVKDRRERGGCTDLSRYCARLEPLAPETVKRGDDVVTTFDVWRCEYEPRNRAAAAGAHAGVDARARSRGPETGSAAVSGACCMKPPRRAESRANCNPTGHPGVPGDPRRARARRGRRGSRSSDAGSQRLRRAGRPIGARSRR